MTVGVLIFQLMPDRDVPFGRFSHLDLISHAPDENWHLLNVTSLRIYIDFFGQECPFFLRNICGTACKGEQCARYAAPATSRCPRHVTLSPPHHAVPATSRCPSHVTLSQPRHAVPATSRSPRHVTLSRCPQPRHNIQRDHSFVTWRACFLHVQLLLLPLPAFVVQVKLSLHALYM